MAEKQLSPTEYAAKVVAAGLLRDALAMLASSTTALRKLTGNGPVARTVLEWRDCATDPPDTERRVLAHWRAPDYELCRYTAFDGWYDYKGCLSAGAMPPIQWADVVLPDE